MTVYLTIMVTVLVATQVVRITQNGINLHMQNEEVKRHIKWFDDREVSEHDFDIQRECFYMLHDWLKEKEEQE